VGAGDPRLHEREAQTSLPGMRFEGAINVETGAQRTLFAVLAAVPFGARNNARGQKANTAVPGWLDRRHERAGGRWSTRVQSAINNEYALTSNLCCEPITLRNEFGLSFFEVAQQFFGHGGVVSGFVQSPDQDALCGDLQVAFGDEILCVLQLWGPFESWVQLAMPPTRSDASITHKRPAPSFRIV
jgi:hypothetical protein